MIHNDGYDMATSGMLCKPTQRVDYRAEWMRQGLVIPIAAKWDQDSSQIPKEKG